MPTAHQPLVEALRRKFKSHREVADRLGIHPKLLEEGHYTMRRTYAYDQDPDDQANAAWIIDKLKQMIVLLNPAEQGKLLEFFKDAASSGDLEMYVGQGGDEPLAFTPSPFENEKRLGTDARKRLRLAMDQSRKGIAFLKRYPDASRIRVY